MKAAAPIALLLVLFPAHPRPALAADPVPSAEAARLASPAVQRRLRALARDLEDGLLTQADYEARRKSLLSEEALPPPEAEPAAVRGAVLGVAVRDVEEPDRELLRAAAGALVMDVTSGSPAAAAGLRAGDVIGRVDGQPVATAAALVSLIASRAPGDRVRLGVTRRWAPVEVEVTLAPVPAPAGPAR